MRPTRVAVYTRVGAASKGRHGEAMASDQRPELQEKPLRRLAEQRGWTITRVYCDRVIGAKGRRPQLDDLLVDARTGRFDVLMVWRFDHLSRTASHFLQIVEKLHRLGIDFVCHEQSLDTTTAMGKVVLAMFEALAELERKGLQERIIAGLEHARIHGTRSGLPIGRPKRVFDRARVLELRRQGLSWRHIARRTGVPAGTARRAFQALSEAPQPRQDPIAGV